MLQVFYLNATYVSHICCKCMFQIFHLLQTYVAFKCFMLQVFRVLEVCSESPGGTAWALGEGARQVGGRQMGRTTPLGSCGRDVLASSRLPGPAGAERGGGQREGVAGIARVCVRGRARRMGDGRAHVAAAGAGEQVGTAACVRRPDMFICSGRPCASKFLMSLGSLCILVKVHGV